MSFVNALFYFCGFIGCAAISFAPLRVFELIIGVARSGSTENARVLLLMVAIFASAVILLYEVDALLSVYACLTSAACIQPGIRVWTYLAMFGMVYLGFEAVFLGIRRYVRCQALPHNNVNRAKR